MMTRRFKITLGLVGLAAICALWMLGRPNLAQRELEQMRRLLRQQGFKIELKEFDLSLSPELSARAALLATTTYAALTNRQRVELRLQYTLPLLVPAGTDAAIVMWRLDKLPSDRSEDLWPELRRLFIAHRPRLDAARGAALAGPIRFEPINSQSPGALLPYLADVKELTRILGWNALLALHDGDYDAAWTNLLAQTCLVTAYAPEPIYISHLVRFACATIAYETAWSALQSKHWTEAQLAELQRLWESAEWWSHLPETAAMSRAMGEALFELGQQEPSGFGETVKEAFRSPRWAWSTLKDQWRGLRYRHQGAYEDERALLLHYRDLELGLRAAIQCSTWLEMSQVPGLTNLVPFRSRHASPIQLMLNKRQRITRWDTQFEGLLGRAAMTEVRRRVLITALALERYQRKQGVYPKTLDDVVSEVFLPPAIDFMNGEPLRYRRTDDGHFVLYSVGLDEVDDQGEMPSNQTRPAQQPLALGWGGDLVWPRPASGDEVQRMQEKEHSTEAERLDRQSETEATDWWQHIAQRQARAEIF